MAAVTAGTRFSETNLPAELYGQYTTIEYSLQRSPHPPPAMLFVVDTCVTEEEMGVVRDTLQQCLNLLPETTSVGLVAYGTNVQVFEPGFAECTKSYVFRGSKDYSLDQVQDFLGLRSRAPIAAQTAPTTPGVVAAPVSAPAPSLAASRIMQPLSECSLTMEALITSLPRDPWPVKSGDRPVRCTGTALSVAVSMLESLHKGLGGRIVLLTGGAPTTGPGQVGIHSSTSV